MNLILQKAGEIFSLKTPSQLEDERYMITVPVSEVKKSIFKNIEQSNKLKIDTPGLGKDPDTTKQLK